MKVAAVFIIYNPDIEELNNNILKVINDVDTVILWLNSKCNLSFDFVHSQKIVVLNDGSNHFIAKPLNEALDYCVENDFTHLLTMDQDSEWENLNSFLNEVKNSSLENVVIYAPNINRSIKSEEKFLSAETVITSGALHNVYFTKQLGGFREDYKIYWVDSEFCYWARKNGYKIYHAPAFSIKHKFGNPTKKKFGIKGYNYSPIVYYFMFRNMFWMRREHGNKAVSTKTILYTMKLLVPGIILFEREKFFKIAKIIKGIFEGLFYKIKCRRI